MVGENNVGVPELIDSHHPQPFRLVPFSTPQADVPLRKRSASLVVSIRYYRPPIESAIVMQGSHPVKLLVGEGARKVVSAAGPWKLSGDWWKPEEWEREEWDLALSDGTVCRLACVAERWFLEGVYD
jgi:protein ImuB